MLILAAAVGYQSLTKIGGVSTTDDSNADTFPISRQRSGGHRKVDGICRIELSHQADKMCADLLAQANGRPLVAKEMQMHSWLSDMRLRRY